MKRNREVQSEEGHTGLNRVLANWLSPDSWPRWLVYVFAVAVVLATLLLRLLFGETFFESPLLILFVLPILLSAYLGGLGPGLVATLASALGISYRLIPPAYSLAIDKSSDFINLIVLIIVGVLISVLSEFLHRLRRHVETARLLQAVTLASIGDAVIATDNRGRITFLNLEAERLTGWSYEEALGQPLSAVFRIINEQTRESMEDPVAKVLASRHVMGLANHTLLLARDGREISIDDCAAPIKAPDGAMLGVVLVFHDCTAKRQAEAALQQSEDNLRLFIEYAPVSLAMFDRQMRYLSISRRWLTDYNLNGRDILGLSHYEVFPEISEHEKEIHRRGLAGEVVRSEGDRFERLDGSVQYLRWEVRPWYDASGGVAGIVIFTEDITARQEAEDALRRSLAEKTALLKEVHHRVKNNLQIVVSLLSLQANRAPHPEVVRVLEDTRRRVHSMALLHEALYRSDSLARINFASYVEDLCRHLRRSMGAITGRVEVENHIAPFGLPLEQSIPCGLIINELVSNALKHAFPDNRAGKITVSLGPTDAGHLLLRVIDNGVGPPPVLDLVTTPTLGLRLVAGLASQLAGQLTVEQPDGVGLAFQVVFPVPADTVIEARA